MQVEVVWLEMTRGGVLFVVPRGGVWSVIRGGGGGFFTRGGGRVGKKKNKN